MSPRPWNKFYVISVFVLLFMILSRLTWMQLRHYPYEESLAAQLTRLVRVEALPDSCKGLSQEPGADYPANLAASLASSPLAPLWLSPGLALQELLWCRLHQRPPTSPHQWQMPLIMLTVMAAVWLARFLSRSWLVALLVGATLLSRGALLSRLGTLSVEIPLNCFLTLWLASMAHFMRTGSVVSFLTSSLALSLAALYEPLCLGLFLTLPFFLLSCYLLFRRRFAAWFVKYQATQTSLSPKDLKTTSRGQRTGRQSLNWAITKFRTIIGKPAGSSQPSLPKDLFARGNLFRTIDLPFTFWIYHQRRWLKLSLANFLFFALGCLSFIAGYAYLCQVPLPDLDQLTSLFTDGSLRAFWPLWLKATLQPIDFHYAVCLALIFVCCLNSPIYGLVSLAECIWIVCLTCVVLLMTFFVKGLLQFKGLEPAMVDPLSETMLALLSAGKVFVWIEPIVLTLGIVCLGHLLRVMESHLDQQAPQGNMARVEKVFYHKDLSS